MNVPPFGADISEALQDPLCKLDLHTASSVGDLDHLVGLDDVDFDSRNRSQWSALMYAAYYDHCHVVTFLLDRGVKVLGAKNAKGRTALMMAAMCGNDAIATMLIRRFGKEILVEKDDSGMTALFHAVVCGHAPMTQLLLDAGADPNVTENAQGFSTLMMACLEGHESVVRCLVRHGVDVDYSNILGENAKTVAAKHGHDRIVKLLWGCRGGSAKGTSVLDGPARLAEKLERKARSSDLEAFLRAAGVEKYLELFQEKGVDLQKLLAMTDEDLKGIGISLLGPRRKLTSAIARHNPDS